ncbi:MAG: class I SAM-dependent methyltransferase [Streptomyces sp.]|nr:class I SAM-dependent methyltransferase [Streptomyces sp.]
MISTSFCTDDADTQVPAMYSRWEARHILTVLQPSFAASDGTAPVLDVCAGHGRLSLPLLEAGHLVDAIDISQDALDRLRRKAADRGWSSRLSTFLVDVANFARPDHYAFAYCAANSIRYLGSRSRVQRHLRLVHLSLRRGGAYLVHAGLSTRRGVANWTGTDGRRVHWAVEEVDALTSETVERVRVVGAGSSVVAEELQVQVLLQGADLAVMAEAAGFTIGAVWEEDFARRPADELGSATGNVWVLLRK